MSLRHQIHRSAVFALVIAFLLTALPAMMIAQSSEAAPKAELFVGYQWLNPGGNIPDFNVPPNAFHLPAIAQGAGASLA